MQELDATDRRILAALDEDPRVPVMVLAQKLGLARGTVQSRLERMSASGALPPEQQPGAAVRPGPRRGGRR